MGDLYSCAYSDLTNNLPVALKFFRTLISLQDTFYQALMTHNNTFGLILDIVYETMPRDNLLNSACLELFEFIKRENIKPIVLHVVEKYGEKLRNITYVDTFQNLILRYEQMQGYGAETTDTTLFSQDDGMSARMQPNGRWQGVKEMDAAEEEYFNASDDEDEVGLDTSNRWIQCAKSLSSGNKTVSLMRPWVLHRRMALLHQSSSPLLTIQTMMRMMPWIPKQKAPMKGYRDSRRLCLQRLMHRPNHPQLQSPQRHRHLLSDCQKSVGAKKRTMMS